MKITQIVFAALFAATLGGCNDVAVVSMVKNGHLGACPDKTVETLVDNFFGSPKWEGGDSEKGGKIVNIKGQMTYAGKPVEGVLQFDVNEANKTFQYAAFEINGVPKDNLIATELIVKLCAGKG